MEPQVTHVQAAASLGVLGGLGPLASARFVESVYVRAEFHKEQSAPSLLLISDPSFPDRTEAMLGGQEAFLVPRVDGALRALVGAGATHLVICCFTLHHIVPLLSTNLRQRLILLPEIALRAVLQRRRPALLLCTEGARHLGVFERDPLWKLVQDFIRLPKANHQREIHELLYRLKAHGDEGAAARRIDALCDAYGASDWIAGCTELHLVASGRRCTRMRHAPIDPLLLVAASWSRGSFSVLPEAAPGDEACAG